MTLQLTRANSPKRILIGSTAAKLILAPFFAHPLDMTFYATTYFAFQYVGIYPGVYLTPYGPATGLMFGLSSILGFLAGASALASPLYFNFVIKLPLICADTFVGYLIFRQTGSTLRMTLWALSPISIWTIVFNAHPAVYFGASLLFCIVLLSKGRFNASAVWLGIVVAFQYVGLLLVPIIIMELRRFAPKNSIKTCSACFVASALIVSLPLLFTRYAGDWLVKNLIRPTGPVAFFAFTGLTYYRGADLNLIEYLKFDLGIIAPSFLYTGLTVLAGVLLLYFVARRRLSTELWVTALLVAIFLVYPQLHIQHLLFALPLILISKLKARVAVAYNFIALPSILSVDRTQFIAKPIANMLSLTYVASPTPNLVLVRATYFVTTTVLLYALIEIYRARARTITPPRIREQNHAFKPGIGIRCITGFALLILVVGAFSAQAFPNDGVLDRSQIVMTPPFTGRASTVREAHTWIISGIDSRYFTEPLNNFTTFMFELHAKQILPSFQAYFNRQLIINASQLAGTETAHWKPEDDGARRATVKNQNGTTVFTDPFAYVASWGVDVGSSVAPANSVILVLKESPGTIVDIEFLRNQTVLYADTIVNQGWSAHSYSLVSDDGEIQPSNSTRMLLQGVPVPVDQLMIRIIPSRGFPFTERVEIDSLVVTNAFLTATYDAVVVVPSTLVKTQSQVLLTTPSMNVDSISLRILLNAISLKPVPIFQNSEALLVLLCAAIEMVMISSSYPSFLSEARVRFERILRALRVPS